MFIEFAVYVASIILVKQIEKYRQAKGTHESYET